MAGPVGDFYSRKIPRGIFPVNSNGGKSEYFVKRVVVFYWIGYNQIRLYSENTIGSRNNE